MNEGYTLMKEWQVLNDEPISLFDHNQVKYYITYDVWDDRLFVESCVGYVNFGLVCFSSQVKAKQFLQECGETLLYQINQAKKEWKSLR